MNSAEFRCTREFLGLSIDWISEHFGVSRRSVERWEGGVSRIPEGVASALTTIGEETEVLVADLTRELRRQKSPEIVTFRTDGDYGKADGSIYNVGEYTAGWHRALSARVRSAVPKTKLLFFDEVLEARR